MEDDDRARAPGQRNAARLAGGQRLGQALREAPERAVRDACRLDRDDAVGAQQVLGLLAQDELLQRARQEQDGDRAVLESQSPAA
jgi:hypothetical protein